MADRAHPPQPEEMPALLAERYADWSIAGKAHVDQWHSEVKQDAAVLGMDVHSPEWVGAWTIAGGAFGHFLRETNFPPDTVAKAMYVFWCAGLLHLVEEYRAGHAGA